MTFRPRCNRKVEGEPAVAVFKPAGQKTADLAELVMTLDEFEALRLADLEGLYQDAAAERMAVSRATFGRILATARRKVAEALVEGHALRIEGGAVTRPSCGGNGGRGGGRGGERRGHGHGRGGQAPR